MNMQANETFFNSIFSFLYALISALYFWFIGLFLKEKDVVLSFVFLLLIDIILGIISSIKQGRSIRSTIMMQGVSFKIMMLFITSLTALILKYYAGIDLFKMFVLIGAFIEFKSITEHIKIIWGISIFDYAYKHFKEIMNIKKEIKNIEDGNDYHPTDEV